MVNGEYPGVSVVIPTIGRPELERAIASVLAQDYLGRIELIVVDDRPDGDFNEPAFRGADILLRTGGGRRGGAARNIGIAAATEPFVALLDDDDEWKPWKLSKQIPAFAQTGADLIGTQFVYRNAATGSTSAPVPSIVKPDTQSVSDYLFRRRSATAGRPLICTPTLVARAEFAKRVKWDESLVRHQDWDWIDRMEREGARVAQIADPSAVVWTGSDGSISSSSDWASSLVWADTRRGVWNRNVLSDFLAGQTLRYAIQARSFRGVGQTVLAIARTRRIPSVSTMILGLGGLVPRTLVNRMLSR